METRVEPGVVLITGASSGIGFALAERFARAGRRLVLVGRKPEPLQTAAAKLTALSRNDVSTYSFDLSEPDAAERLVKRLDQDGVSIETLVNSAGVGLLGSVAELGEEQARMIRLNVDTLADLTRRLLPGMLERGEGKILNIASIAAFLPGPKMSAYYASKAFVRSYSEGLADELRGSGVSVTCLCPGPTLTEFGARAGAGTSRLFRNATSVDAVARVGYRALERRRGTVIVGFQNQVMIALLGLLPRPLVARIVRRIHES